MFTLHISNRMERLADRLAAVLAQPLTDPLQPEVLVVQSRGMERWLSMELSRRSGICANMQFPFPNALLEMLVQRVLPDRPPTLPLDPDILTFRILMLLPELLERPDFAMLRRYLADDRDGTKRFRLAGKIARTFDQYLVYRPDWIFRWESGGAAADDDDRWQGELWRRLTDSGQLWHRATLQRALLKALNELRPGSPLLPQRIGVFGISYLPPFHLQLLAALSRRTEVHFFLLDPCCEYWADIVSDAEAHRMQQRARRTAGKPVAADDLHLERGHPLLASLGGLGRDFLAMVSGDEVQIEEDFEDIAAQDCLSRIQADILHLRSPGDALQNPVPAGNDPSVQIHSCHSAMREIEVLHDRLLAMFEDMPELQPKDILVITPDIDVYAPYIHAVFGSQFDESRRIPYRIADLSLRRESRILEDFFALLRLRDSRFGATEVLGLLESPQIRARFHLSERAVGQIEQWIRDLNIRWGIDADMRRQQGLPEFTENTWRAGIERMLLGLALPGEGRRMFGGILPYDRIEGALAGQLGDFLDFLQALFDWSRRLDEARSLTRWQTMLLELLETFFRIDERAETDLQAIREALARLGSIQDTVGDPGPLSIDLVEAFLDEHLQQPRRISGFIAGGVTFGAMLPMRSIPFAVIALIGMNHDAFPREDRPPGFDRMAHRPRRGDRSRRTDDRYLFLEALLSARRRLYISYIGQSIQDNSAIPPAVPVSELIDAIRRESADTAETLVLNHPLQAFSPRYFDGKDARLFSFAEDNCVAAGGSRSQVPPFFEAPLPEPAEDFFRLTLAELCRFISHPSRFLLQRRLGIRLEAPETLAQDRENFRLNPLDRYRAGNALTAQQLEGIDADTAYRLHKADGSLPQGMVGRVQFTEVQTEAAALARKVAALSDDTGGGTIFWRGTFAQVAVSGRLRGLHEQGRVQFRFSPLRAPDLLEAWIRHLALGLAPERPCPPVTFLVGSDSAIRLLPVDAPERCLEDLLSIYREGLLSPLPFFPNLSLECVVRMAERGQKPEAVLQHARKQWEGSAYQRGIGEDPYHALCFRQTDPFDERFLALAVRIFGPLRAQIENLTLPD